jgi:hypothetical protein
LFLKDIVLCSGHGDGALAREGHLPVPGQDNHHSTYKIMIIIKFSLSHEKIEKFV